MNYWQMPIVIGRHTHADVYDAVDMRTTRGGLLNYCFEPIDGSCGWEHTVHNFSSSGGVFMSLYQSDHSI